MVGTTRYRETIYVPNVDAGQISCMYRPRRGPGVLGRASMEAFPFKGQS